MRASVVSAPSREAVEAAARAYERANPFHTTGDHDAGLLAALTAAKDAEIAALREALKPFAQAAAGVPEYTKEIRWVRGDLLDACRRARAALEISGGVL